MDHNGVSQTCYITEMCHSGRERLILCPGRVLRNVFVKSTPLFFFLGGLAQFRFSQGFVLSLDVGNFGSNYFRDGLMWYRVLISFSFFVENCIGYSFSPGSHCGKLTLSILLQSLHSPAVSPFSCSKMSTDI